PTLLGRGEGLAAPFPIHPRKTRQLNLPSMKHEDPIDLEEGLAEIVGGAPIVRFAAEAVVAMENKRLVGGKIERIAKARAVGRDFCARKRRPGRLQARAWRLLARLEDPVVDPRAKRLRGYPGLFDAAAGEGLCEQMLGGGGHRRMAHPDRLVGPALALVSRRASLAEQRPLNAVGGAGFVLKIGGQIPPFRAKAGMRAKISRENQRRSRDRLIKTPGVCTQPREPFVDPSGEGRRRREQGQRGKNDQHHPPSAHWQKPSPTPPAWSGRNGSSAPLRR